MAIEILQADITSLHVDAIVNAANETLLGGAGEPGRLRESVGLARHGERRRQDAEGRVACRARDGEAGNDSTPSPTST